MKPALILGLALAANAMAADSSDNNELFVAPQGKLAEFAKRHPEIKFDEQADDELAVKYVHLPHIPIPEITAYDDDELSLGGIRPRIGNDDEFCGKYRNRFRTEQEYHKFCATVMDQYQKTDARNSRLWKDDELRVVGQDLLPKDGIRRFYAADDDELAVKYVHLPHITAPEIAAYDDDELSLGGIRPRIGNDDEFCGRYRNRFRTEQEYHKFCASIIEEYKRADAAARRAWGDDELRVVGKDILPKDGIRRFYTTYIDKETGELKIAPGQYTKFATDDELFGSYQPDQHTGTVRIPSWQINDEDDELLTSNQYGQQNGMIRIPSWQIQVKDDEVTVGKPLKFDKHEKTTLLFPGRWIIQSDDEVIADELFGLNQSGNTTIIFPGWTMHFSDDELALRAPRVFIDRPLVKPAKDLTSEALVRDDEVDDELVYLGKLIKDQSPMSTEGPRIKRKLRPVADNNSLAQN